MEDTDLIVYLEERIMIGFMVSREMILFMAKVVLINYLVDMAKII